MNRPEVLRKILLLNELSGNQAAAYRFSDADGPRGPSGYSFGICQFDLSHNPLGCRILGICGFTDAEVTALRDQTCGDLAMHNAKLLRAGNLIDQWDRKHCEEIVNLVENVCKLRTIRPADDLAFLALCDYHNQFDLGIKGKLANTFAGQTVTAAEIFDFKLNKTEWGQGKGKNDVRRRHANLMRVWEEETNG